MPAESIWFSKRNPDSQSDQSGMKSTLSEPLSPGRTCLKKVKKSPKKKGASKEETIVQTSPHDGTSPKIVPDTPIGIFPLQQTDEKIEVWFHESCLIWAPGVCLVPPRLVGLDEAVSDSQQVVTFKSNV